MKCEVVKDFKDIQDNGHIYRAGDPFPRAGAEVSEERIKELASKKNKRNEVLIQAVEDAPAVSEHPKHTGGGYYELSSGDKVKGKDKAIEAEKALHE